jgi:hypothetical protein
MTIGRGLYPARVYVSPEDRIVRLATGKPRTCVRIEPTDGSFSLADIDPQTITMTSTGTAASPTIAGFNDPSTPVGDHDGNGVDEIAAFFTKEDLRRLFDSMSGAEESRDVTVGGRFLSGGEFRGHSTIVVMPESRPRDARVTPNPTRGAAVLSFRSPDAGRVTVRLYDVHGRLVRAAYDGVVQSSGYVDIPMVSAAGSGRLPSGIYFYRLEFPTGEVRGRFAVLK